MAVDPFFQYLIIVNMVAFLAFALDFFLCMRNRRLEDNAANSLILNLLPVAGGAAGMLISLLLLTGLGRGHRMNKDNVAWWFLAITCSVAWALVCGVKLGFVQLGAVLTGAASGWRPDRLMILAIYLAVVNVATFCAFAWDKHMAASGNDFKRRIPEARLLGFGLVGGSLGGLLAMRVVRHKTRKWYFVWGLPCFIILDAAIILLAHACGVV